MYAVDIATATSAVPLKVWLPMVQSKLLWTHSMAQKQGGDSNQCKRLHGIIITGEQMLVSENT